MIDTQQATCKHCGKPVPQKAGKRKREYCNDVCRQLGYRERKRQKNTPVITITNGDQAQYAAFRERETRYRQDVDVHHFKSWLRKQHRPGDIKFVRKILDDTRLPEHGPRSRYIALLRYNSYPVEEIYYFEEIWKDLLSSKL